MAFFTREGVDAGEHVVAVTTQANCAVLREALGHPLDDDSLGFRKRLRGELATAGIPSNRADELILAATEVLSNAHRYGDGPTARCVGHIDGRFVCEISDHGPGLDDPLAGYLPPGTGDDTSAGLWVARQLTHRLDLISSADGLTVRLWA
jgi:anti-sigma regulatory factor (Ser/Thr protein kinase)